MLKQIFKAKSVGANETVSGGSLIRAACGDLFIIPTGAMLDLYEHKVENKHKLISTIIQVVPATLECETAEE